MIPGTSISRSTDQHMHRPVRGRSREHEVQQRLFRDRQSDGVVRTSRVRATRRRSANAGWREVGTWPLNGTSGANTHPRYANTDYIVGSLLRHHSPKLRLLLSYDIACQYSKNFEERLRKLPPLVRFKLAFAWVRFVIPKLHIHGHRIACQLLFNLAWTHGVGRTDGEGVERPWSFLGALGASLRQMGPGSAADTLDDHLGYWNWLKLIGLGVLLLRRLADALTARAAQKAELEEFRRGQAARWKAWEGEVDAFERDSKAPNPFELPKSGTCRFKLNDSTLR